MSSHRGRPRPNRHGRLGEPSSRRSGLAPSRAARGRGAALSLEQIAEVALAIADAEGLDAVSIRRIARELGSGAMSLYHYFDSRDELLDLMADRVAAEMVVPDLPADWRRRAAGDRPPEPRHLQAPPVAALARCGRARA